MSQCSSGHDVAVTDRFCSHCGVSALDDESGSVDAEAPGALLLTGSDDDNSARSSSQIQAGLSRRWLLAGGLAVLVLAWVLFVRPSNEAPIDADASIDETGDEAADETDDTSDPDSETETEIQSETETGDEAETSADAESDSEAGDAALASGPILGEESGLGLVVGGLQSAPLELVNLDTGETHELGERGLPLAVVDNSLMFSSADGTVKLLDLSTAGSETVDINKSGRSLPNVLSVADGLVWLAFVDEDDASILRAFDSTGEEQDSLDLGVEPFVFGWNGDPSLIYHAGGGIYESDGDGYRRVSPGFLRASDEKIALVSECNDAMACEVHWYDRGTWDRLPLPAPQGTELTARTFVVGADRWLVETSWEAQIVRVTDIETGAVVREYEPNNFSVTPVAISDDGRWLLDSSESIETFVDLETGTEWEHQIPTGSSSAAVFVDLDGTIYGA